MKQGTGTHSYKGKQEPVSHTVSVPAVSQLGNHVGKNPAGPIQSSRGVQAPTSACTSHPSGSQGKHR